MSENPDALKTEEGVGTENGKVIGKLSPDFPLYDASGKAMKLSELCSEAPVMLVFYPGGPIKPTCIKQFCDYRDNYDQFQKFGIKIIGVSSDSIENQKKMAKQNNYPFIFMMDPGNAVAKLLKAKTFMMLGNVSRALYIVNKKRNLLYRYVENTWLTRRGSPELLKVLEDLQNAGLL